MDTHQEWKVKKKLKHGSESNDQRLEPERPLHARQWCKRLPYSLSEKTQETASKKKYLEVNRGQLLSTKQWNSIKYRK